MKRILEALPLLMLATAALSAQEPVVDHDLQVRIDPESHRIEARDTLTLSPALRTAAEGLVLRLHADLEPRLEHPTLRLVAGAVRRGDGAPPVREYRIAPASEEEPLPEKLLLRYAGIIHHPIEQGAESARSFSETPGIIEARGAFLGGSTHWFPEIPGTLVSFQLSVELPGEWDAVSQGQRTAHDFVDGHRLVTWNAPQPTDTIYLVAAPFHEFSRQAGKVRAQAFLREDDKNLATRYLEVTAQYIGMYERLIGPYPYRKFALVENFWETGYGMPSFTLLGPRVIRLPFILHSSYPHEILHNWWGNSVFVDYAEGNWCEGLTAYLADHLIKEGQGKGAEYRRDALKKYRNFVRGARDFPLSEFSERHSEATEAVGYGKSLMVWHMLRRRLGDEAFTRGLQRFYREFRFRRASWSDIARTFSGVADEDLDPFFEQWVQRAGAPELELGETSVEKAAEGWTLSLELFQDQKGGPFDLRVPLRITLDGGGVLERIIASDAASQEHLLTLPSRPLHVAVDPDFDLFRRLHHTEIPATLGQVFGAPKRTIVLPKEDREAWRALANAWSGPEVQIVHAEEIEALPDDRSVWLLGSSRWVPYVYERIEGRGGAGDAEIRFGMARIPNPDHAVVYVTDHPSDPDLGLGWIDARNLAAIPGLARKLPHYGKYSYLAFKGDEPTNVVKGQWPQVGSPLRTWLAPGSRDARPAASPVREPLASLEPVFDPAAFAAHVDRLASPELEGRGVGTPGLDLAGDDIASCFEAAGLRPGGDGGSWFQSWTAPEGPEGRPVTLRNVVGVLPGKKAGWEEQSVVVGAHYDHLGFGWPDVRSGNEGKLHPGADDNASGIAVLLELARLLGDQLEPDRAIVFVAFSGEEWGLRGSRHYVKTMTQWPVSQAMAMINLDTVGRLGDQKITLLGTGSASEWIHIAMGVGFTTGIEAQCVGDDLGTSDQRPFLEAGVPAIQVFTGGHEDYHRPSDTPDKVDVDGLVKIATFVRESVVYLAGREKPLTSKLTAGSPTPAPATSSRKVSLGTLPDFAFPGPGVRVARVMDGTPAAKAGLRAQDLLLAIDGQELKSLRHYSDVLKSHQPGDTIEIRLQRDEETLTVEATLIAR